jgi:DNA-binding MurR/RpiR family transcriptional regulator
MELKGIRILFSNMNTETQTTQELVNQVNENNKRLIALTSALLSLLN